MTYVDDLSHELSSHGVRGRHRRRILAEFDDHLRADPHAEERLGSPRDLANEFAADLAVQASRRSAVAAFAALAVAGAVYAAVLVSLAPQSIQSSTLTAAALVVAPQVAFVAGVLALVRAFRLRNGTGATAELTVVRRRTGTALAFGGVTMVALALATGSTLAYASIAVATVLLVAATVPLLAAARFRPQLAGTAEDVFDDLGFERLRMDPWRFACLVAGAVGAAVWLAGIAQGDPIDGLLRGALEAAACLAGFIALGRYLGLRR
jgi:hypothetical protein